MSAEQTPPPTRYHYTMDTTQNMASLRQSFVSPKKTISIEGMEETPPPNPNSTSPFSIIKRHADSLRYSSSAADYWRLVGRYAYRFREGGQSLTLNGKPNNKEWAKMWVNLHRLPAVGLMCLNTYQLLGGSFVEWYNMHNKYYQTRPQLLDAMNKGEEYYRKNWKRIFDIIGHKDYSYSRVPSSKKKRKTKSKRPLSPSARTIAKLTLPSSKKIKSSHPSDDLHIAKQKSIQEYHNYQNKLIEDMQLRDAITQSQQQHTQLRFSNSHSNQQMAKAIELSEMSFSKQQQIRQKQQQEFNEAIELSRKLNNNIFLRDTYGMNTNNTNSNNMNTNVQIRHIQPFHNYIQPIANNHSNITPSNISNIHPNMNINHDPNIGSNIPFYSSGIGANIGSNIPPHYSDLSSGISGNIHSNIPPHYSDLSSGISANIHSNLSSNIPPHYSDLSSGISANIHSNIPPHYPGSNIGSNLSSNIGSHINMNDSNVHQFDNILKMHGAKSFPNTANYGHYAREPMGGQFINYQMSDGSAGTLIDKNEPENMNQRDHTTTPRDDTTTPHPLEILNETHAFKSKANAKGKIQKKKKKENIVTRRGMLPIDKSQSLIKTDIKLITNGTKDFADLTYKSKCLIGIGIMNSLHESDQDLSSFEMWQRDSVRSVLVETGGGSKTSYNVAGFLTDDRCRKVKQTQKHDNTPWNRFTLANTSRKGYFVDHKLRQLVDVNIINQKGRMDTATNLIQQFKTAMESHI